MSKTEVVSLTEEDVAELERIIMDRDEAEALVFLKSVVWKKIKSVRRKQLDPSKGGNTRF